MESTCHFLEKLTRRGKCYFRIRRNNNTADSISIKKIMAVRLVSVGRFAVIVLLRNAQSRLDRFPGKGSFESLRFSKKFNLPTTTSLFYDL